MSVERRIPLGELLSEKGYVRGPFGSALVRSEMKPFGVPVYEQQHAITGSRVFRFFVDEVKARQLKRFEVRPHDLIISCSGTVGRVSTISETDPGGIISQALLILRPDSRKLLPQYLRYFLESQEGQHELVQASHGSVQANIAPREIVEAIPVPVPSPAEQLAIVKILGSLDDKIELNRRLSETLEAIAHALFQSWFVDFDPVRAKASGEAPESICQRLGLTPDLLALFPDRLVDSELGEIPEGWEVRPLDQIANYLNGLALQKFPPTSNEEWLPVIKIAQLKSGSITGADRASHELKPEYIVDDGDVLFSWSGSLEVDLWCNGRGALNQHLFKVTSSQYPKWFYFLWTKHHLASFRAIAAGKAVTMGHIQRKHLTEALCAVPSEAAIEAASAILAPMLLDQIETRKQSRELSAIRDGLLPRLLSGEIQIAEGELP